MSDKDLETGKENNPFFEVNPDDRPCLPFADFFQNGMGTENVAPFLYSMIRMVRPVRLLEIGLGYTTPWLLRALEDNEKVHIDWNADSNYFKAPYEPLLICIDDMSAEVSSARKSAESLKDNKYIRLVEAKFQGRATALQAKYGMFDFVWFDCGGPAEYEAFCDEFLPICSGYVFFHFTYYHGQPTKNLEIIKSHITKSGPNSPGAENGLWDYMDIIEPHKYRQGSVTMLRRRNVNTG